MSFRSDSNDSHGGGSGGTPTPVPPSVRPPIKWAGGKTALLDETFADLPTFGRYLEVFLGGGAPFFKLAPKSAIISDTNAKLINMYVALRDDPHEVVRHLRMYENTSECFYATRARNFSVGSAAQRAAEFIAINKTCFNGLHRENQSGQFNTPFGDNPKAVICDTNNLLAVSAALQGVDIRVADFEDALKDAQRGDLAYCDPPYAPLSATSNFTGYQAKGFTVRDQVRLRELAVALKKRGVRLILSNSHCPFILELYAGFDIQVVEARRSVNCKGGKRGAVKEVIIR